MKRLFHIWPAIWAELTELANARDGQKRSYKSSRYWNPTSHLHGLAGEWVFEQTSGIPMNRSLDCHGDNGTDFPGTDVKTSTHVAPHLKHPVGASRWAPYYALVKLDLISNTGAYIGYACALALQSAPARSYRSDAGPQHYIPWHTLLDDLPPPCKRVSE